METSPDVRTHAVNLSTPRAMKYTFVATNKRLSSFEKEMKEWRREMEEWRNEKAAFLSAQEAENRQWKEEKDKLKEKIDAQELEILALKRELAEAKTNGRLEEGEIQPSMMEELNTIKEQVRAISEEEKQNKVKTSSWVDTITNTQKKVEEAEKWIAVAKKGNNKEIFTPTPTIINMTLEEEQRRRTRALHVRVTGLRDRDNVNEEVKELMLKMGIDKPAHTRAWRVGKKSSGNGVASTSKDRALILRFPSVEGKKEFLKKRPTLKKTGIFLGDDLTLAQVAHMQEVMPEIRAAREKGKIAFYRDGRVMIIERSST